MSSENSVVFLIDDDPSVRRSLSLLIRSAGYQVLSFGSAEEFLAMEGFTGEGCIILDVFLDGQSGLDLQEEISRKFCCLPIIYITGQGDIPMSVQAMKRGAVNFLQKPVNDVELLNITEEAIARSRLLLSGLSEITRIKSLFETLTPREYQIYNLLITGMLNKQIAAELSIAEHTVKLHRGKITEKLGVKSVAELLILAHKLNQA
jgi:FixJ family two-component response regulator